MRQILIMTCLLAISGYNLATADDSIPERELNEITVVGERGWFEDGILNIIPSKSEKKLSNSPVTLVDAMNIPFLKSREGSIVNMAGEEVKIFINGPEAKDVENAEIVYGTGNLYLSMRLEDMFMTSTEDGRATTPQIMSRSATEW